MRAFQVTVINEGVSSTACVMGENFAQAEEVAAKLMVSSEHGYIKEISYIGPIYTTDDLRDAAAVDAGAIEDHED